MTVQSKVLTIRRPDDWHIHLRDGEIMKTVIPYTSEVYGRAIIMPNLTPSINTIKAFRSLSSAYFRSNTC